MWRDGRKHTAKICDITMEKQKASSDHRLEKWDGRSLPSFSRSGSFVLLSVGSGCVAMLDNSGVDAA